MAIPDDGRIREGRWWVALAFALLLAKWALAVNLDLLGDEAFYRWESRHPALGYSDVPALTPWLIRIGTDLAGQDSLGVRWPFLLLGLVLPWLTYRIARLTLGRRDAGIAAGLGLLIPLSALSGLLALPDMPLTIAMLASLYFVARLERRDRWRDAVLLGFFLALGWLSHYRFAMLYLAGAIYLGLSDRGNALTGRPKFWVAHALGIAGLMPAIYYNVHNSFSAMRFQFVERHPWSFHADALGELPIQAIVTTPLLFAVLVIAAVSTLRAVHASASSARTATQELCALLSLALLAGYLILDCFADATHLRLHWPLPAYLFALPLVPPLISQWRTQGHVRRMLAVATPWSAAFGVALAFAWMANAARPLASLEGNVGRYVPDNVVGWSEVAAWGATQRLALGADAVPIADNFMLGAEWANSLGDHDEPYVLDHPLNTKHGRAAQLATWGRDEGALRRATWRHGLLLVEETVTRPINVLPMYRALCPRFGRIEYRDSLVLRGGRSRFLAFSVEPGRDSARAGQCRLPSLADLWSPLPGARADGNAMDVHGWATAEFVGVSKVEVLLDGAVRSVAEYGLPAPEVENQWPMSEDPNHPNVGFRASLDLGGIPPGAHAFSIRVTDSEGRMRLLATRMITR